MGEPNRTRGRERGGGEEEGIAEPVLGIPNSSKPSENSRKVPFRTSDLGHIISTVSRYSGGPQSSCEWFVRVYWLLSPFLPSSLPRLTISPISISVSRSKSLDRSVLLATVLVLSLRSLLYLSLFNVATLDCFSLPSERGRTGKV